MFLLFAFFLFTPMVAAVTNYDIIIADDFESFVILILILMILTLILYKGEKTLENLEKSRIEISRMRKLSKEIRAKNKMRKKSIKKKS